MRLHRRPPVAHDLLDGRRQPPKATCVSEIEHGFTTKEPGRTNVMSRTTATTTPTAPSAAGLSQEPHPTASRRVPPSQPAVSAHRGRTKPRVTVATPVDQTA